VRVLARYPEWVEKLPWGGKIVGLRIELAKADASVVKALVGAAWEAKAPKGLRRGLLVAMPYRRAR
jgi:hypothetical protein